MSSSSSSPPLFPPPPLPLPPPLSSSGISATETTITETIPETTIETSSKTWKAVIPEPLTTLLPPPDSYRLDQIKNGALVESLEIRSRNRLIIGRAPDCDVTLEHASVSRYHAALLWAPKNDHQYRQGENRQSFWYLVDCGSTHGTTCNKHRIDAGKMIKLSANNNVLKFGASSRIFTLTSSSSQIDDEEEINDHQPKIEMRSKQKVHSDKSNYNDDDDDNDQDGCSWGMGLTDCTDDAEETADAAALRRIIGAMKNGGEKGESGNRNAYADNAYKCLQQWFEREGQGSDFASYRVEQQQNASASNGKFRCTFELPIDGQWIPIEGEYATRKKDAIADACMKCCEILDQAQLLFPWQRQNAAKKSRKAAYGDDDDDDYDGDMIDETLSAARKRRKRYEKETSADHGELRSIETYETLNEKWKTLNGELRAAKIKLATIDLPETASGGSIASGEDDPLDAYMSAMQGRKRFGLTLNEKIEKSNLRCRIKELEAEQAKVEQLIELAKPVVVEIAPSAAIQERSSSTKTATTESNTNGERKNDDAKKETEEKDIENIDREVSTTTNDDDNNKQSSIDGNQSRSAETKKSAKSIKEIEMSKPIAPQQQSKPSSSSSSSSSCSPIRSENLSKAEKTKMARKLKQGSIVEAIEKEKRLEARQQVRAAEIADENDPDYVGWTPPIGQSGDGRTHLNDKFGY